MLRFSKAIKIKVLCANLVERHYYDVLKKVANPKLDGQFCNFSMEGEFGEKSRIYRSTC